MIYMVLSNRLSEKEGEAVKGNGSGTRFLGESVLSSLGSACSAPFLQPRLQRQPRSHW